MIDTAYLRKMAGLEQADAPAFEALIDAYDGFVTPRPIAEYHEDMGDVLWWCWVTEDRRLLRERATNKPYTPHWLGEPPYVGSPNDLGITVEAHVRLISQLDQDHEPQIVRRSLGGWPGYHTHFTPIPMPRKPNAPAPSQT